MANTTLEIDVKLGVDRRTAETCLRLVEMYVNQNNVNLIVRKRETVEVEYELAR